MKDNTIALVLAADDPGSAPVKTTDAKGKTGRGAGDMTMTFVMMGGIILIFYLLVMKPQKKKQDERTKMISAVQRGDKVTTVGGIIGKVESIEGEVITLRTGDTKIKITKTALSQIDRVEEKK